jgi:CheY-like chemotaxis protein
MRGVILGHAEIALEQLALDHPVHSCLEEILKAAHRSANLTRQLLAFARKQIVTPEVLDLNTVVAGMLKMLRRLIGEDIDLIWKPGSELWPVKIDASQIDQILANLCVNARDAIAGVGKVIIETGNVSMDKDFCENHPGCVPGDYMRITVSDNGCGMEKETVKRLFEPFFTTKGSSEGTGLGLATVYGIVKQNRGFTNVYSEPGKGTTFKLYLPRHIDSSTEERLEIKKSGSPCDHGGETVLLVEDETVNLKLYKMMLERLGYKVLPASTPDEAIRLAENYAGEIHLVITDVIMPKMNGKDLVERLLKDYPNIRKLFMSGYTADVIANHGVLEEGVHFIEKPFTQKDLGLKVRLVLDAL